MPKKLCFFILLVIWIAYAGANGLSPFALSHHKDPDWSYLFNALGMRTLDPPGQVDHPGLTAHWLYGAALSLWHLVAHRSVPVEESVLTAPEEYLYMLGVVTGLLAAAAFSVFGTGLWRRNGAVAAALFTLFTLCSPEVALNIRRANPEGVFLVITPLLLLTLLSGAGSGGRGTAALFGAFAALGIGAKVVFSPLLLFLALWRKRGWWVGAIVAVAVFALLALPALSQWGKAWVFWRTLLTHSGNYGAGPHGFLRWDEALVNLKGIWSRDNTFFLLLPAPFLALWLRTGEMRERAIDLCTALLVLAGLFFVAKHGMGDIYPGSRYLLPISITLAWRAAVLGAHFWRGDLRWAVAGVAAILITSQAVRLKPLVEDRAIREELIAGRHRDFFPLVRTHEECWLLVDNSFWSRYSAFLAARDYATGRYITNVDRLYPRLLYHWAGGVRDLRGSPWIARDLVANLFEEGKCFLTAGLKPEQLAGPNLFGNVPGERLMHAVYLFRVKEKVKASAGGAARKK